MNKLFSNIFWLTVSIAFVLDAVNFDALFMPHGMVREEYTGQSSEIWSHGGSGKVVLPASSSRPNDGAYLLNSHESQIVFLIDEDSLSLPALPAFTQERNLFLWKSLSANYITPTVPHSDFYSLCKLQI